MKINLSAYNLAFLFFLFAASSAYGERASLSACASQEGIESLVTQARDTLSRAKFEGMFTIPSSLLQKAKNNTPDAQMFTEILCAEYSDRPEMLRRKLEMYSNILEAKDVKPAYASDKPIWSQLTADGYHQLVFLHKHLAYYRSRGSGESTMTRLPALMTQCEIRYQFANYVSKYRGVWSRQDFKQYEDGLSSFLKDESHCTEDERSHYVAFRGDGALMPHVMESSVMKSFAYSLARYCSSAADEYCLDYARAPYSSRNAINNQILTALLSYKERDSEYFEVAKYPVFLLPDSNGDKAADYIIADSRIAGWKEKYGKPAHNLAFTLIGKYQVDRKTYFSRRKYILDVLQKTLAGNHKEMFHEVAALPRTKLLSSRPGKNRSLKRLQILFDRHADYYRTFYYDPSHNIFFSSASPWSSSSSYIHQSHKFSVRGYASDTMKQERFNWMTIYKVPKDSVYSRKEYDRGEQPDFSKYWFKESDFGKNKLAREELALDSLGMPEASTLEALIWLGEVKPRNELMAIVKSESNS